MTPPPRIAAIVLAAGASSRLGAPKQLLEHDGVPLVRRAAHAAADAGANPVVVVVGAHADAVAPALDGAPHVEIAHNAEWADGMASSLRVGIARAAECGCDAFLVTLADQPLVDAAALGRVIAAYPGPHGLVAAAYGDTLGAPALFAIRYADALSSLTGDAGAGAWLRRRARDVVAVPLGAAALDVDVPADVARLCAHTTT